MTFRSGNFFSCFLFRVIDSSMKNFKAFFRWLYVGKLDGIVNIQYQFCVVNIEMLANNKANLVMTIYLFLS